MKNNNKIQRNSSKFHNIFKAEKAQNGRIIKELQNDLNKEIDVLKNEVIMIDEELCCNIFILFSKTKNN